MTSPGMVQEKVGLRPPEQEAIQAIAQKIEEAMGGEDVMDRVEESWAEVYTHEERDDIPQEVWERYISLALAQAAQFVAEQYFLKAAGVEGTLFSIER